jgi:hypothetical protein
LRCSTARSRRSAEHPGETWKWFVTLKTSLLQLYLIPCAVFPLSPTHQRLQTKWCTRVREFPVEESIRKVPHFSLIRSYSPSRGCQTTFQPKRSTFHRNLLRRETKIELIYWSSLFHFDASWVDLNRFVSGTRNNYKVAPSAEQLSAANAPRKSWRKQNSRAIKHFEC